MANYCIFAARPHDIERLPEIELAAAQLMRGFAPDSILNEATGVAELQAAQAEGRLWVAADDGAPVGFALVEMLAHRHAHLKEIDVDPRHGRRGLGAQLVAAVCEWAALQGHQQVTLTTYRGVPWNMPFYVRLGFAEIPTERLPPELEAIVQAEANRGLLRHLRVAMRYQIDRQ